MHPLPPPPPSPPLPLPAGTYHYGPKCKRIVTKQREKKNEKEKKNTKKRESKKITQFWAGSAELGPGHYPDLHLGSHNLPHSI